jgi:alpha-glucosidase (family GH31 glycosyl hydrolase)
MLDNIRVSVLTDRLFRIERDSSGQFCDEATLRVWFRDMEPVPFAVERTADWVRIDTGAVVLTVDRDPDKCMVEIDGISAALDNRGNFRSTYRTLDCCNGNILVNKDGERPIELEMGVASANGVAVLDDTEVSVLNAEGMVKKRRTYEQDWYVFAYGRDYRGAVKAFYRITGPVPKLPRYAMGNWWSRYYAYTEQEYLRLMERMEEQDIPLTVAVVDMDWHWSTTLDERKGITAAGKNDAYHGGASGWTGYSWNTDLFPDYRRFLKKLRNKGLAVSLNLHPATGVRWFEDMYPQMAEAMGVDPASEQTVKVDFTSDRFINAYFDVLHKPYERDGVDFWWIDWQQGPRAKAAGIDIMWVLNHYHMLDNSKDKTGLILSRYAETAGHRYQLGFSGDTHITWETLRYLPYFTANATNIGFTWWSHDIGGHMDGYKNDELYARSVQFGVFSPVNRLHSSNDDYNTKEPHVYMNGTGHIAEEFMRLRHRMIPFLHAAAMKNHRDGEALIEPMYYGWPQEKAAYECPNQYLFGGQLIVAPVTAPGDEKHMAKTSVWLPEGTWTDIFTGNVYRGGRTVDMVRYMDTIPVLAKEGGFFVLDGRRHTNRTDCPDRLEVQCYNGTGCYTMPEEYDDFSAETVFTSEGTTGRQTVTIRTTGDTGKLPERTMKLEFRNIPDGTVTVCADGQVVEAEVMTEEYLTVTIADMNPDAVYTVTVAYTADEAAYRTARLLYTLTRVETTIRFKRWMWMRKDLPAEELRQYIMACPWATENEKIYLTEAW